jgi:hypothetical protein
MSGTTILGFVKKPGGGCFWYYVRYLRTYISSFCLSYSIFCYFYFFSKINFSYFDCSIANVFYFSISCLIPIYSSFSSIWWSGRCLNEAKLGSDSTSGSSSIDSKIISGSLAFKSSRWRYSSNLSLRDSIYASFLNLLASYFSFYCFLNYFRFLIIFQPL